MSSRRFFFELHTAHRLLVAHANQRMIAAFGVSSAQLAVLYLLAERGSCTAADVARALSVRKSAVSGMVRRLEDAGLVLRAVDEADARRAPLALTPRGEEVRAASLAEVRRLQDAWLDGLSPDDVAAFARVVDHTLQRYGDRAPNAPNTDTTDAD